MKPLRIAIPVLALLVALGLLFQPASAEDESGATQIAQLAKIMAKAKVPMTAAVATAEGHAKGKAVAAKIELDDGRVVWEVFVLVADTKVAEVEIDAVTGALILEGEEDGDSEDDESEDDDSEDDESDDEDSEDDESEDDDSEDDESGDDD